MRRSLFEFLLLDSLLFFLLVSGGLLDDLSDGKKTLPESEPPQAARCLPNITSNGVPLNATISRVLSSPKVLSCVDTISKALKAMFQLGKTAQEMRRNTTGKDSVKDLCPAFVNLTSTVFWSGYRKHPGPNFRAMICSKDILTNEAIEDRDFCTFYQDHQSSSTTTLELLEEYPKVASVFQELTSMGGDCEAKCGKGSKRVLCNAFFALARLLSLKDTKEQESKISKQESKISNQAKSGSTPTSAEKKDATTSNPGPDRSDVIRDLATPILSLSRHTLDELVLAAPNMLEFSFNQVEDVSPELRAELLKLEDICVILRMFWIVKISPERLRSLSNKSWNAILIDPVKVFPSVMWFEKDEEEEVRSFQNLEQVVKYIYRYRKIILIDLPTVSSDEKLLDRALVIDETENSHKDQEVDFDSANPPPNKDVVSSNADDGGDTGTNGKGGTAESGSISTITNLTATNKDNESSMKHVNNPSENDEENKGVSEYDKEMENQRLNDQGDDDPNQWLNDQGDDDPNKFHDLEKKPDPPQENNPNKPHAKPDPPQKAEAKTPPKTKAKPKQSGDDDDDGESTGRSYGPFHFLTLFLVVGAVVVVTYVCMHNRKKLREGVGTYMSGKSKRRRVRDYKPLATSET